MAPRSRASRTGLQFVGMLRNAIDMDESGGPATLCHYLPVTLPDGQPQTFTVYVAAEVTGTFSATCRDLVDVRASGTDEAEALARAERAIRDALDLRSRSDGSAT
jgi:hypothetical protein